MALSLTGAFATGAAGIITAVTKFNEGALTGLFIGNAPIHYGAWLILLLIPLLVGAFRKIGGHYGAVAQYLTGGMPEGALAPQHDVVHTVLVLVPGIHRGVLPALQYARSLSVEATALHIALDPSRTQALKEEWRHYADEMPLVILEAPYRNLREPLLEYVEEVLKERPGETMTVVVPELVSAQTWWHRLLHNSSAAAIRRTLAERSDVIVTSFRYFAFQNSTGEGVL
jgi:hypothetical protein